jgi:anti-anti-sigma regulatory factor
MARKGQRMLRISIHDDQETVAITLDGRIAGPWVAELRRAWMDAVPSITSQRVSIDLRNVTYADASGRQALREIYTRASAELVTNSPWTQYLAETVRDGSAVCVDEEAGNANNA